MLTSLLLCGCIGGCIPRERINERCEWQDAAATLDLSDRSDRRHLIVDVQVAEDLGIRFGDSFRAREGIEEERRRREQCTATLFAAIARLHDVTLEDVRGVRGRRDLRVDATAVMLPMALFLGVVAYHVTGRIHRRFPSDERLPALAATCLMSLFAGVVGFLVGDLWSGAVEWIRLGNGHLSYRAFYRPWVRHPVAVFIASVCIFWLVASFRYRALRAHSS